MTSVTTRIATPGLWRDVQHALTGGGDGASCQCLWPVLTHAQWRATTTPQRTEMFRGEVTDGPPPGVIAYVDDEAAGWVRIGPRPHQERLARTRIIATASPEPFDDPTVWAVTCFVVRREHRGTGLNSVLLNAAVDYASDSGARMIEGYPVDTNGTAQRSNDLFHGTLTTFLAAGFQDDGPLKPGRSLVSKVVA